MYQHIQFSEENNELILLDQRVLPLREEWVFCRNSADLIIALRNMTIRGAPAIGVAAAYGCLLAALEIPEDFADWRSVLNAKLNALANARPTAVNLRWAVELMRVEFEADKKIDLITLRKQWLQTAKQIHLQDIETNRAIGRYGAALLADGDTVMTHCNAGALATAGYGTALGVIRQAIEQDKRIAVIANETRPFLQGARLTAYELSKDNIPVKVACDNACGLLMAHGLVDKVIVGADRIAANGDTANKIGTYMVAVLAKQHNIPFYVAAPASTFDFLTPTGKAIPIEERPESEVTHIGGFQITPDDVEVFNFAFDVTPAEFISGIITEYGVLRPPYVDSIAAILQTTAS